jgi:hypothetical protein
LNGRIENGDTRKIAALMGEIWENGAKLRNCRIFWLPYDALFSDQIKSSSISRPNVRPVECPILTRSTHLMYFALIKGARRSFSQCEV